MLLRKSPSYPISQRAILVKTEIAPNCWLTPHRPTKLTVLSRVDRCRGICYGYGFSRLFPELGQTLYKDVADRDEKDADKGCDSHAKHDRSSHDAARCGTRTLR